MVKFDERRDRLEKGRVGPGQTIGVDLDEARFYGDEALKDLLSARQPFGEWAKRIRQIDHIVKTDAPEPVLYEGEALRRRQLAVGTTLEELEMILHPMVEDGRRRSAAWATTRRSPCCRRSTAACTTTSARTSAQVTNPPIDSLRETRVMTLKTRLGNLGNVLDEDSSQFDLLQLESPVLSTAEFAAMRATMGASVPAWWIAPSRSPRARPACAPPSPASRREAEEGVRAGRTHVVLTDEALGPDLRAPIPMILATSVRVHTHLVRSQPAHLHQPQRALAAECMDVHYFAVLIGVGATTVNAYHRAGEHRRPPPARPVRPAHAEGRGAAQIQEGGRQGPAQDHVQDGHLRHLVLSRRLQLRGDRAVARAGGRVLSGHAVAHLRHGPRRHRAQGARRCTTHRLGPPTASRCPSAASTSCAAAARRTPSTAA